MVKAEPSGLRHDENELANSRFLPVSDSTREQQSPYLLQPSHMWSESPSHYRAQNTVGTNHGLVG